MPPSAHSIEDTRLETWRKVMRTNGGGDFPGCKFGVAAMKTQPSGGTITNMPSVAARGGLPMTQALVLAIWTRPR